MKFQRFSTHSALYPCCAFTMLGLKSSWLCFGAREVVKSLSAVCVEAVKFSVPCGQKLPDRAESRVAQFNEGRDDLVRGGDHSWYARSAREECGTTPSAFAYFSLSYSMGFWLLFIVPIVWLCKHQRCPSLCVWRCFSSSNWECGMLHLLQLG